MKRVNNLYNSIVDIKTICDTYDKKVKHNTKNKSKLVKFDYNYVSNIYYIYDTLYHRKYKVGKYNIFLIKEPKVRLIMSQNIIDKIINHLVSYVLIDVFDKTLINENVATRVGRGSSLGIKLLKKYLNEFKDKDFYVLKFDVSKYFYSLDHEIIKSLIRRKIKDKELLKIVDDIIDSTDSSYVNEQINKLNSMIQDKVPLYEKGKGVPIGNLSSQLFGVLYLNELDHFIKEKLKVHYIRYMDDGILIHEDKEYLKYCLVEIEKIIRKYKLNLNNKTRIYKGTDGFEFLGFRYYIKNNKVIMKVNNQTKRKFKRKMKNMYHLLDNKKITYDKLLQVKSSYLGHLKLGNCNNLIYRNIRHNDYGKKVIINEQGVILHIDEVSSNASNSNNAWNVNNDGNMNNNNVNNDNNNGLRPDSL